MSETPRSLTESEIVDVCSVLPQVSAACPTIAAHNFAEIRAQVAMQLREIKLKPSKIESLKAIIYNRCMRAQVQPGDTVGLQAAEAISQPTMQMVMNTFHKAGSTEVGNSGLQVISELLNLRKLRKVSRAEIHFRKTDLSFRDGLYLSKAFVSPSIKSLLTDEITGVSFHVWSVDRPAPRHYALFEAFTGIQVPSPTADTPIPYLRLTFDTYRLYEARITMSDIAQSFRGYVLCVPAPTSEAFLDIFSVAPLSEPEAKPAAKPAPKLARRAAVIDTIAAVRAATEAAIDTPEERDLENIARAMPSLASPTKSAEPEESRAITAKNAPLLFLQTFIAPKIANETFVATSRVAQRPLASLVPPGYISNRGTSMALFRRAEVVVTNVTQIVRGATQSDPQTWRVWIDLPKVFSLRVPREKVVVLCKTAFPDAKVRLVDATAELNDHVEMVFAEPQSRNPFSVIKSEFTIASERYKDDLRETLSRVGADKRALRAQILKQRPAIVVAGEYVHIRARAVLVNLQISALSRLITHPAINARSTITNNFYEIAEARGIEAARAYILQEIIEVIGNTGSKINPRHVELIVDVMTSSGTLMPFTPRPSVLRQQNGAYSDSSFDQAPDAFRRSAIIGAPEPVTATSAAILLGTVPNFGTGTFRIVMPGGYVPPAYLTTALAEATESASERTIEAAAEEPYPSLAMISNSRLTEGEALSAQTSLAGDEDPAPIDSALGFNPNLWPPVGVDATYGTLSDREAMGLF